MQRALAFAGATEYLDCGELPTGGLTALTVELWARCGAVDVGNRPLAFQSAPDERFAWALYVTRDGRLALAVQDAAGEMRVRYSPPGLVEPGQWRHYVGSVDAGQSSLRVLVHGRDVSADDDDGSDAGLVGAVGGAQLAGYLVDAELGFVGCIGWARVSRAVRYAGSTYRVPWAPPAVDALTLAQWNMRPVSLTALTVVNAQGEALYDGVRVGATWTAGPAVGQRTCVLQPRTPPRLRTTDRRRSLAIRPRLGWTLP